MKMHTFHINKLCRDKTVTRLEGWGAHADWMHLDNSSYEHELRAKLREEAEEVCQAEIKDLASELADVLEVIDAICKWYNISAKNLQIIKAQRFADRGGFYDRIFVKTVSAPSGSFPEKYYRTHSDKYPEKK